MSADLRLTYMMVDLGILSCADQQKLYMRGLLTAANAFLRRRGVTLSDDSDEDDMLVGSVAAWMYRARGSADRATLPKNLDVMIKDRICHEKMGGAP